MNEKSKLEKYNYWLDIKGHLSPSCKRTINGNIMEDIEIFKRDQLKARIEWLLNIMTKERKGFIKKINKEYFNTNRLEIGYDDAYYTIIIKIKEAFKEILEESD